MTGTASASGRDRARVGGVLVTPAHQYPTGAVLSPAEPDRIRVIDSTRAIAAIRAELEAGLISLAELRSGSTIAPHAVGSEASASASLERGSEWTFDLKTRRTEFTGLTLLELTVREDSNAADATQYTIRQLVRLRPADRDVHELDSDAGASGEGFGE